MSTSPVPRALTVVRTLIYIRVVFALIIHTLALIGFAVMTDAQVYEEMEMSRAASIAFMLVLLALTLFEFYVAATLRRGGRARQWCVRVLAGIWLLTALFGLLAGDPSLPDAAIAVVVLAFHESRSARTWYRSGAAAEAVAGEAPGSEVPEVPEASRAPRP
ncbi:hypothetical protein [Nocardiopsis ganjiahuensis]|uniref:hypothetical protein n=1 Tax=Nocardiopsis ganjiahuensis TaxID=239984 RepID=UPI000347A3B7|nr:hypothetical protein [Nocardiopsis ganjiahuensis]